MDCAVFLLFKSSKQTILHDRHKLSVAQLTVHIFIENCENNVNDMI